MPLWCQLETRSDLCDKNGELAQGRNHEYLARIDWFNGVVNNHEKNRLSLFEIIHITSYDVQLVGETVAIVTTTAQIPLRLLILGRTSAISRATADFSVLSRLDLHLSLP